MTDEELNALVKRLDDMSDLSRDHAAGLLDLGHKVAVNQAITAITTLRAQLAEAQHGRNVAEACNRGLVRLNEATQARADRAEAALAAQIEVDRWQPIETAPTDDDAEFLVWDGSNWYQAIIGWRDEGRPVVTTTDYHPLFGLTHWRNITTPAQPHDRTALDRMLAEAREQVQRKLAETIRGWRNDVPMTGDECANAILALINEENVA